MRRVPDLPDVDLLRHAFDPDAPCEPDLLPDGTPLEALAPALYKGAQEILGGTPPSFPWFASQILAAVDRPDTSAAEIAAFIGQDALIATQLLRIANSAYYSRGTRVSDLRDAVSRLGLREVAGIAATASTQALMNRSSRLAAMEYPDLSLHLWTHSIGTSIGAGWLATEIGAARAPVAFLGGLLHDIGKMIGLQALAHAIHAGKLPKLAPGPAARLLELVHKEIGLFAAETCKFPEGAFVICRDHHKPPQVTDAYQRELHITVVTSVLDELLAGEYIAEEWLTSAVRSAKALRLEQPKVDALAARVSEARRSTSTILGLAA